MFIINAIFWLWLFIVPTGVLGLGALWLYLKSGDNLPISIIIALIGFAIGVMLAEYVRKKYGLDIFFGRLHGSPDIDGVDSFNIKKSENDEK